MCLIRSNLFALPCGHGFCANCHSQLCDHNAMSCPLCRAPFKKYQTFEQRLATFTDWEFGHIVDPSSLAAAGLVRMTMKQCSEDISIRAEMNLSYRDATLCSGCGMIMGEWQPGDVPRNEHRRHMLPDRSCPFVQNK